MFGVSLPELLIVLAVLLIVLGPDRLPEAARNFGKFMGVLRRQSISLKREFYTAIAAAEEAEALRSDLNVLRGKFLEKDPNCPDYVPDEGVGDGDPATGVNRTPPPDPTEQPESNASEQPEQPPKREAGGEED